MIRIGSAMLLARAKLRTKRVLLAFTIIVSALLFGLLFASSFMIAGVTGSIEKYNETVQKGGYFVSVRPRLSNDMAFSRGPYIQNQEHFDNAKKIEEEYIAYEKARAKEENIPFDESNIKKLLIKNIGAWKGAKEFERYRINQESPAVEWLSAQYAKKYIAENPNSSLDALQKNAQAFGIESIAAQSELPISSANAVFINNNKENFGNYGVAPNVFLKDGHYSLESYYKVSIQSNKYSLVEDAVMKRFMTYKNEDGAIKGIPVIATADELYALFKDKYDLPEKPSNSAEQLQWFGVIREKVNGATYQVCYRNAADMQLLNSAIAQKNSDEKNVTATIEYELPKQPCGEVRIVKDNRSIVEKQQDNAQKKLFGITEKPSRTLLTFQVVGTIYIQDTGLFGLSVESIIKQIFKLDYKNGAFIPTGLMKNSPLKSVLDDFRRKPVDIAGRKTSETMLAEANIKPAILRFNSIEKAKAFINAQSCEPYVLDCDKPFNAFTYGTNYLIIQEMRDFFDKATSYILPGFMTVAAIILALTIGRVLADSRRETAVFRAVGAKRGDIMIVYIIYSLYIALFILLTAFLIGLIIAGLVHLFNVDNVTNIARTTYGIFEPIGPVVFVGIDWPTIGRTVAVLFVVGLIAALPAIASNIRRNPIDDLRSE